MDGTRQLQVEASGETVGEAKWVALRELEHLYPGLDRSTVRFQVISEGERGLLGVGYAPARVLAIVEPVEGELAEEDEAAEPLGEAAARARELVVRVSAAIGVRCRIDVVEDDEAIEVTCTGGELGLLIGRHGQTIDAIQYLANAISHRGGAATRKEVIVDAAGYRARRRRTLESLALRSADEALARGRPVELEPMSPSERKVVHLHLKDHPDVETASEGVEPNRYVVVLLRRP